MYSIRVYQLWRVLEEKMYHHICVYFTVYWDILPSSVIYFHNPQIESMTIEIIALNISLVDRKNQGV